MLCIPARRLSLSVSVVVCTFLATIVHAQTQPGASNGGLTVTLPTTGGDATTLAGTHAGTSTPLTRGAWLQAFSLPPWRTLFVRGEPVRQQVRDRRVVKTR